METRHACCLIRVSDETFDTICTGSSRNLEDPGWTQQRMIGRVGGEADQALSGFSSNGDTLLNDYMRLALDRNPGLGRAFCAVPIRPATFASGHQSGGDRCQRFSGLLRGSNGLAGPYED